MERLLAACKYFLLEHIGASALVEGGKPDFLGIGVPQSATTWLFDKLQRHPEVFIPESKELEYFNKKFYRPMS